MKSPSYSILHFYPSYDDEIKILQCFKGDDEKILFHCWECFLMSDSNINVELKNYILDRTIMKTYKKVFGSFYHQNEKSCWYTLCNNEEFIKEFQNNYDDYICAVLKNGKEIEDYSYLLMIDENYPFIENDDCRALMITVRDRKEFEEKVLPSIREIYKKVEIKDFLK